MNNNKRSKARTLTRFFVVACDDEEEENDIRLDKMANLHVKCIQLHTRK